MSHHQRFSMQRFIAVIKKEFIQMRRDKMTFAMIVGIPLIQLILFGFAINSNPKHLPTAIISGDHSLYTRRIISALQNSDYFKIIDSDASEKTGEALLNTGKAGFIVTIPTNFTHDLLRGMQPHILITADATDPVATANAIATVNALPQSVLNRDLMQQGLPELVQGEPPFTLTIHAKYNPEAISQYNIVPGLMGVVLTMTLVMITALAITREFERGTMESLLATPVRPLEVMLGKITPYIVMGYCQQLLILFFAWALFSVPILGSLPLLVLATFPFIVANLSVGLTFSTVAKNQLQAVQMTFFFFLPSILLSGFMFPFNGMPYWARCLGEILPLTHFLRIVRGIMLKGNMSLIIWQHLWPILLFMLIAMTIGLCRYRQTLD